jgi:hypothetical protein
MARFTVEDLEKDIERPEPFEFEAKDGTVFTFPDARSLHFTTWTVDRERGMAGTFKTLLGEAQYEKFAALPEMDGYLTDALFEAYNKHFGIPSPGESDASSA